MIYATGNRYTYVFHTRFPVPLHERVAPTTRVGRVCVSAYLLPSSKVLKYILAVLLPCVKPTYN